MFVIKILSSYVKVGQELIQKLSIVPLSIIKLENNQDRYTRPYSQTNILIQNYYYYIQKIYLVKIS